jgi:large subunit ribosomal protein L22
LEKLLLSAISNWENKYPNASMEEAELYVAEISVDSGRMLKRLQPAPQGRAHRIRKRSNHINLMIAPLNAIDTSSEAIEEEETETAEATA